MRRVAVDERGNRIGETHPRAKLTDAMVRMILVLHEQHHIGYDRLAVQFEVSKTTIQRICTYQQRVSVAARFKDERDSGVRHR